MEYQKTDRPTEGHAPRWGSKRKLQANFQTSGYTSQDLAWHQLPERLSPYGKEQRSGLRRRFGRHGKSHQGRTVDILLRIPLPLSDRTKMVHDANLPIGFRRVELFRRYPRKHHGTQAAGNTAGGAVRDGLRGIAARDRDRFIPKHSSGHRNLLPRAKRSSGGRKATNCLKRDRRINPFGL